MKMAAAYDPAEGVNDGTSEVTTLTETEIVAQAITELQQICAPSGLQARTPCTSRISKTEAGSSTEANSLASCYFRNEEGVSNGQVSTDVTEGDLENEATQVIYYIEDGVVAKSEKVLVDTSVQANDYEIERRSGRVPARRRVIPYKFRDFKNTSNDEDSDSDYEPDVKPKIRHITKEKTAETSDSHKKLLGITAHKRPGRPRKTPLPVSNPESASVNVMTSGSAGQTQIEVKEVNIMVIKEERPADEETRIEGGEITAKGTEENAGLNMTVDDGDDDVTFLPTRKGRGRPRGPDWRKDYKCPHCGKLFAQKGNMKTHLRVHTGEKPFPCREENCGKLFRSAESLRRHVLSHKGIKPFECDICHNKFSSNVGLQEHKSRHTEARPHKCPHCSRQFRQVSCLRRHVFTHSSDKPFACQVCQQRFSQMAYLKSHMKVHTGEKPFHCDICQKKFAHQSDVKRHKITHTGEKRYCCEICQARFSDPSSKRRHQKEHSKKKAYLCQMCDETFSRGGQLKAHLASKHMVAIKFGTEKGAGNSPVLVDLQNSLSGLDESVPSNQRIVQLIKSLSTKTSLSNVDTVEIDLPNASNPANQTQSVAMTTDHVTQISQLQEAGEAGLMESAGEVPIELQGIEIQEEEEGGQTYIAITDLAESLLPSKGSSEEGSGVYQYQIIQEIGEDGDTHQVLVPYNQNSQAEISDVTDETVEEDVIEVNISQPTEESNITTTNNEVENTIQIDGFVETTKPSVSGVFSSASNTISEKEDSELVEAVATVDNTESTAQTQDDQETNKAIVFDYVTNPDFSSQDYYNWLSKFTELCKVVPLPLDVSLFQKISQVHKTLSDIMATPSGVVADKENFRVLMNITKELSTIINEHLVYILENLNPEETPKDSTS